MEFIYLFSEQSSVLCFVFSNHFQCLLRFAVLLFSYIIFSVVFTATALGPRHEVLVSAVAPVPVHAILELARGLRSAWDFSKCGPISRAQWTQLVHYGKTPQLFDIFRQVSAIDKPQLWAQKRSLIKWIKSKLVPARGQTKRPGGQSETVEAVEGVPPETLRRFVWKFDGNPMEIPWKSVEIYENLRKSMQTLWTSHRFWNPEIGRIWWTAAQLWDSLQAWGVMGKESQARLHPASVHAALKPPWTTNRKKSGSWITATLLVWMYDLAWSKSTCAIHWQVRDLQEQLGTLWNWLCCREGAQWLPFETPPEPFNISTGWKLSELITRNPRSS